MKSILTKAMLVAATTLSYVGCEESTPEKNPPEVTPIVEISTFDDKPHSDPNGQRWNVGDGIVLIDYIPEGTNFQLEHRDRVHDITQQPVINSDAGLALGTGPEVISDYSISQRDAGVPDSRTEDSQLPDAAILDAETLDVLVDAALPTARDLHEEGACMTTSSFEALGSNPDSSNAAYRILLHADQSRMGYGMPIVNGEANSFRLLDRNLQASLYLGVPIFWDGESANFGTLLNRESRNGERVAIQNFEWTMQGENYCDRRTSITSLEQARWCINQDPARFELYDENCNEDDILPDEEPALPVIPDVGVPIEVDAAIPELFSGLEFEGTLRYEDGEPVYTIVWDFGPDNRRREEGNQIFTPENVESMRRIIDLSLGVAYKLTWGDDWQEQMEDPFIRSFADPIRIGMNTEGTCGNNRQSHPGIGTTVLCTSPEHFISDDAAPTHGIITHEGEHIANAMNARPYFMREFTAVVVAGYAHTRVTNQEVLNLPFEELIDQEPPRRDFSYDNELWKKWENRTNGRRYGVADQGAHLFSQLSRRFGFTPVTNLAVQDAMLERFREINNNQIQADMAPVPLAEYLAIMIETLRIEDENQFIEVFHENGVPPSELHPTRPGIHPKEALYSPRSGNVIFSLFNGTQEERRYEVRIEGCIIPEARNDLVNLTATELNQIAD
ncbi:TPA: hypothetical protein HA278_06160, partial [Candidatus Woesearchaeota archaeon]|nr:hypothetical protein [Candidatus Woesearchaeota archaeon]